MARKKITGDRQAEHNDGQAPGEQGFLQQVVDGKPGGHRAAKEATRRNREGIYPYCQPVLKKNTTPAIVQELLQQRQEGSIGQRDFLQAAIEFDAFPDNNGIEANRRK